ncbi:MAG: hypothetical protein QG663_739 [Thermodesulfobacteriota bacterium]|nr:hypothetical protein [Thermodesulfobacteriota bacterium]
MTRPLKGQKSFFGNRYEPRPLQRFHDQILSKCHNVGGFILDLLFLPNVVEIIYRKRKTTGPSPKLPEH